MTTKHEPEQTAPPKLTPVSIADLDKWATDPAGPVALHLKQKLVAVESMESDEGINYPPTYADIGYNIDTQSDATRVALIDRVGAQANRLEPIFIAAAGTQRDKWLVPQIDIVLHTEPCGECDACKKAGTKKKRKEGEECQSPRKEKRSILELAHRSADAVVQYCLKDAPAAFRKVGLTAAKYMQEFRDGSPNPERRVLGGVVVHDRIERDVTVNLVALRGLRGKDEAETNHIRKYLLGLSLVAATTDIDLFLRGGCHLRYASEDKWQKVPRRGDPTQIDLASAQAQTMIRSYASDQAEHFRDKWPEVVEHHFNLNEAKKLLAKKDEETPEEG